MESLCRWWFQQWQYKISTKHATEACDTFRAFLESIDNNDHIISNKSFVLVVYNWVNITMCLYHMDLTVVFHLLNIANKLLIINFEI
jgi:hypothetical protein